MTRRRKRKRGGMGRERGASNIVLRSSLVASLFGLCPLYTEKYHLTFKG